MTLPKPELPAFTHAGPSRLVESGPCMSHEHLDMALSEDDKAGSSLTAD